VAFSQLSIQPNRVILDLEGTVIRMPEISLFYGIRVTMYYDDHMPPHFHAEYNGQKILVDILNARIYREALSVQTIENDPGLGGHPPGRIDAELGAGKGSRAS
jgi:hypothetical protein